jgi:hypothetical protein
MMDVVGAVKIGRTDDENMHRLRIGGVRRDCGEEENEGKEPFHGAEV